MAKLFGLLSRDLEEAKLLLEDSLGISMEPRESLYHGGDYFHGQLGAATFLLQRNRDLLDDDLAEPDFKDSDVILYLDDEDEELAERVEVVINKSRSLRKN